MLSAVFGLIVGGSEESEKVIGVLETSDNFLDRLTGLPCGDPIEDTSDTRLGPAEPLWISVDCLPMRTLLSLRLLKLAFLPSDSTVDEYKEKQIILGANEKN